MEAETDASRWAEHNAKFHNVIDLAGNSPRLVAILKNLRELSTLYITHSILAVPDRARQANAEHEEILRAVFAHDPAAAADAVLRHLDGTLGALRTIHRLRVPTPGAVPYPRRRLVRARTAPVSTGPLNTAAVCLLRRVPGATLITWQPRS